MKVINRSLPRELKKDIFKYIALLLVIMCGTYIVVACVVCSVSIKEGVSKRYETSYAEDGEFEMFATLSDDVLQGLDDIGVETQEGFYYDYKLQDETTLRIFKNRSRINLIDLDEGELADDSDEICIEKQYANEHGYKVGDNIDVCGSTFVITGIGCVPDYESVIQNVTDPTADHYEFGLGFVTDDAYESLATTDTALKTECYLYFFRYKDKEIEEELKEALKLSQINITEIKDESLINYIAEQDDYLSTYDGDIMELLDGDVFQNILDEANTQLGAVLGVELTENNYEEELDSLIELTEAVDQEQAQHLKELKNKLAEVEEIDISDVKLDNMISFTTRESNSRMGEVLSDISIVEEAALFMGIIIFILVVYIVSIFVSHEIELQSAVIGTLYSMGMSKATIMCHYIMLPTIVTFLGGIIGTIIGVTPRGIGIMLDSLITTYSLPKFDISLPAYVLVYGIVVPPLTAIIVNVIEVNKKLSKKPLELIRQESKHDKVSKLKLKNWKFENAFTLRQFLRERGCAVVIFVRIIISSVMLMMSQYIMVGLGNMRSNIEQDVKFSEMYLLKYPMDKYMDGERGYVYSMTATSTVDGVTKFDVSVLGIQKDSGYFDFNGSVNENEIVVSSSVAIKFGLSRGDSFLLYDETADKTYEFTVSDVVQYSAGLYVFMDIDTMRDMLDQEGDYYNVIFSDKALDIDSGDLYSSISKEDFLSYCDVYVTNMSPMIFVMYFLSVIVFIALLYLMIKIMLDHSEMSISMMSVFGYYNKEIQKFFLNGYFVIFIFAVIVGIPFSHKVMGKKWPQMVDHVAMGLDVTFSPINYILMVGTMILAYIIIISVMRHNLLRRLENNVRATLMTRE